MHLLWAPEVNLRSNLFVEHGVSADAHGVQCRSITPRSDLESTWAVHTEQALLESSWCWPQHQGIVIARSGRLAQTENSAPWQMWSNAGHEAFAQAIARALGQRQPDQQLCVLPDANDVISDLPSALGVVTSAQEGLSVALAPAQILTNSMLGSLEDHLLRVFEVMARRCNLIYLTDLRREGEDLVACPLGQGLLPRRLILDLLEAWRPPACPVVIMAENVSDQFDWLELTI